MNNRKDIKPSVSIIMPLYNASKYLSESMDCVLGQTFDEFELICINDGSSDITGSILVEYEKVDRRVRVINNQRRIGAALSRNRGIDEAIGDYLLFLDGDDYFEEELIEKCYRCAQREGADIVFFNYGHYHTHEIHGKKYAHRDDDYYSKYSTHVFSFRSYADPEMISDLCATCNKFYRREFIINKSIRFQDQPRQNDIMFSFMALLICDRVIALHDDLVMVHARDHEQPSRITNTKNPIYTFNAIKGTLVELKKRNKVVDIMPRFYSVMLDIIIGAVKKSGDSAQGKGYYEYILNQGLLDINRLCNRESFEVDSYTKLREQCLGLCYETQWWKYSEAEWLRFILQLYKEDVSIYFKRVLTKYSTFILWGCGNLGGELLAFLKENGISFSGITDSNDKLWGRLFHGNVILDITSIREMKNNFIVTTSRKIDIGEVKNSLNHSEILSLYDVILISSRGSYEL